MRMAKQIAIQIFFCRGWETKRLINIRAKSNRFHFKDNVRSGDKKWKKPRQATEEGYLLKLGHIYWPDFFFSTSTASTELSSRQLSQHLQTLTLAAVKSTKAQDCPTVQSSNCLTSPWLTFSALLHTFPVSTILKTVLKGIKCIVKLKQWWERTLELGPLQILCFPES